MTEIAKQQVLFYELEKAKSFIMENDHFLVVSHLQPDGDAASSTMALGLILEALGKSYALANADPMPQKFHYMAGYEHIRHINDADESTKRLYHNVIAVDCADYSRVGSVQLWFSEEATILNIDHHPTNDGFGKVRLIDPEAAATVEILYGLVESLGIGWNKELATCIYTGLLTDTGGFRYSNTTPKVMQIASHMLSCGAEGNHLAEYLLERVAYSHILLLKRALSSLSFEANNRICWMQVTQQDIVETGANNEDLEGLVNYPRNIEGVQVGLLFKEVSPNIVKVSFRSDGNVDVSKFAHSHGGGGHVRAAGCTLRLPLAEAVPFIIEQLQGCLS